MHLFYFAQQMDRKKCFVECSAPLGIMLRSHTIDPFFRRSRIFFAFILFSLSPFIQTISAEPEKTIELNTCSDQELNFKISCYPDWGLESKPNSMMMIIESGPQDFVTVTISKSDEEVDTLSQLTRPVLQLMGQYAENFKVEETTLDERPALKVSSLAQNLPDLQLEDYYVIKNHRLYSLLFACDPKTRCPVYEELFKKMKSSFEFLN